VGWGKKEGWREAKEWWVKEKINSAGKVGFLGEWKPFKRGSVYRTEEGKKALKN